MISARIAAWGTVAILFPYAGAVTGLFVAVAVAVALGAVLVWGIDYLTDHFGPARCAVSDWEL
jgi:hypothetical protein